MTDAIKEAVHEVWVRRVVVIEEECRIHVGIREDEGVPRSPHPVSLKIARGKIITDRALKKAAELIESGTWAKLDLHKTVVAEGAPLVTSVSGDMMQDDPSE